MSDAISEEYTAALCHMRDGEVVPFELKQVTANREDEAVQKATEWAATVAENDGEETWLVLKQGARSVHSKRLP
jgi:hypothetical protein